MGDLFGYVETRYQLDWDKAYESIQAVRKFMRALPGERQSGRLRSKQEDEVTIQTRRNAWKYLVKSGALGHQLEEPVATNDEGGKYVATCDLCGKSFRAEGEEEVYIAAMVDRENCPGVPELR